MATKLALPAVLAFGLLTGLIGVRWGLPGPQRLRAFAPSMAPTPETARRLADRWAQLYSALRRSHEGMSAEEPVTYVRGVETIPAGWTQAPDSLLNSHRALLLQSENPDEKKSFIILSQMRPWKLDFQPLYVVYPGAYIYPLGAFLKALSWTGFLRLIPDMSHYLQNPGDMGRLYLGGRLFILLFQLGSLWVLFDVGRRLGGPRAGVLAALFFALCPLAVTNSHILKPHPYAAFWALLALRAGVLTDQSGRRADYLKAGLLGGLAMGSNFTLAFFAGMPAWAWLGRRRLSERVSAALACALGAAVFVLTNPYFVFARARYAWELSYARSPLALRLPELGTVMSRLASNGMGPALFALAAAGLLAALTERRRERRFLAWAFLPACAAVYGLLSARAGFLTFQHYYYPLVAWACLLAALWVSELERLPRALLVAAVLLTSGFKSGVYLANMALGSGPESTRMRCAHWIEANVPQGATVGLPRYPEPSSTPYFRYDRYALVIFQDPKLLKFLPEYVVTDESARASIEALGGYERAATFAPVLARWATDEGFFANAPMYVYRRRS
jgi:hypothetical protein